MIVIAVVLKTMLSLTPVNPLTAIVWENGLTSDIAVRVSPDPLWGLSDMLPGEDENPAGPLSTATAVKPAQSKTFMPCPRNAALLFASVMPFRKIKSESLVSELARGTKLVWPAGEYCGPSYQVMVGGVVADTSVMGAEIPVAVWPLRGHWLPRRSAGRNQPLRLAYTNQYPTCSRLPCHRCS